MPEFKVIEEKTTFTIFIIEAKTKEDAILRVKTKDGKKGTLIGMPEEDTDYECYVER